MPVNYYLEKRPNKKQEHPIRLSAVVKGARILSTTGISVKEDSWDADSMRVKPHQTNSKKQTSSYINKYLSGIENTVLEFENTCHVRPSLEKLREVISSYNPDADPNDEEDLDNTPKRSSAIKYFDEFLKDQSIECQWTSGTKECWNAFRKHLDYVVKSASLDFFNDDGINAFVRYLRVHEKMEEKTVQKHYLNLRWFLNWTIRRRYATEREIGKIQPKFKVVEKPVIFLTKEELLKLYKYEIPANGMKVKLHNYEGKEYEKEVHDSAALAKTRDLFCFCAFTSLRYSDMASLKRGDIHEDYIDITTQKTYDHLPINLNTFAKEILEKYKDCKFPGGLALPVISNQRMNDYIKELCELCEFNDPISKVCYRAGQREEETRPKYELIGTHAGRRTFICFALSSCIPPQVVMKWTGHSDYKAMKPYIDIAEKTKADAMALFEKQLNGK